VARSFDAPLQMAPPEERFEFAECTACGLLFLADRIVAEEVHRYYDESYLPHRGATAWGPFAGLVHRGQARQDRKRVRRVLDFVDLGPEDRLLDVGCGRPTFLREVVRATGAEVTGIDFVLDPFLEDPEFAGIELRSGDPHDVPLEGSFRAITMWHYLEHDYDPRETLRKLLPHAGPDTILLIEVPDARSRARTWAGSEWAGLHTPRHTAIYTPDSMARLLDASGWEVVASELPPTLDPWVLWWLTWRERRGTDWTRSMARYLPEFLLGSLVVGPIVRRRSRDVLLVAARPAASGNGQGPA
jgi:SAM-dependent methyltransferase